MENRIKVYEKAKSKNPSRWSRDIRDWSLPIAVALNPLTKEVMDLAIEKTWGARAVFNLYEDHGHMCSVKKCDNFLDKFRM